jgi:hypothetical protein
VAGRAPQAHAAPDRTGRSCRQSRYRDLTGDDRALIFGALLWSAGKLKSHHGGKAAATCSRSSTVRRSPLPDKPWKRCRVNLDYHVEIAKHYYRVPYNLLHREVETDIAQKTVFCSTPVRTNRSPPSSRTIPTEPLVSPRKCPSSSTPTSLAAATTTDQERSACPLIPLSTVCAPWRDLGLGWRRRWPQSLHRLRYRYLFELVRVYEEKSGLAQSLAARMNESSCGLSRMHTTGPSAAIIWLGRLALDCSSVAMIPDR